MIERPCAARYRNCAGSLPWHGIGQSVRRSWPSGGQRRRSADTRTTHLSGVWPTLSAEWSTSGASRSVLKPGGSVTNARACSFAGMNIAWTVAGGVIGFVAGMVLRITVFQLSVAFDHHARTMCSRCATPISGRAFFRIRCAHCQGWFGTPLVIELVTATVLALLLWRFAGLPEAAAFALIGTLGVALAAIDIAVKRLPDALTLPLYPGLIALFGVATVFDGQPANLLRALLGGVVLATVYLVLAIVSGGQLGLGDVKLAGGLGIALGWLGWPTLIIGAALGFVLQGVVSLVLLAARRITLKQAISLGPFMLAGALVSILASA
jgi:leader peptidase (prepilin peptidase) / N-methyltransferase